MVDEREQRQRLAVVDHKETRLAVTAERAFLRRLGAGCRLPVGAYAEVESGNLRLRALMADESGSLHRAEASASTAQAERLGSNLARRLMAATGPSASLSR